MNLNEGIIFKNAEITFSNLDPCCGIRRVRVYSDAREQPSGSGNPGPCHAFCLFSPYGGFDLRNIFLRSC